MTDLSTLEAERKRITDEIAALSSDIGRQLPGRKLPSAAGTKVDALQPSARGDQPQAEAGKGEGGIAEVMLGPGPSIHEFLHFNQVVDARQRGGHDGR